MATYTEGCSGCKGKGWVPGKKDDGTYARLFHDPCQGTGSITKVGGRGCDYCGPNSSRCGQVRGDVCFREYLAREN